MSTQTYNLKDISNNVSDQFELTQKISAEITRFIFDRIQQELAADKQVRVHQFGTFQAKLRAAGVARNLATGELVQVPARRVVKFTVSPLLKDHLRVRRS